MLPGEYSAVLTVEGKSYKQPFRVRMDPRVKTSAADLERQFTDSEHAVQLLKQIANETAKGAAIEKQLTALDAKKGSVPAESFQQRLTTVLGHEDANYGSPTTPIDTDTTSLRHLARQLRGVYYALQSADVAPTPEQEAALHQYEQVLTSTEKQWNTFIAVDLPKFNQQLKQAGLNEISQLPDASKEIDDGDNNDNDNDNDL